jgi:hypothetical protein
MYTIDLKSNTIENRSCLSLPLKINVSKYALSEVINTPAIKPLITLSRSNPKAIPVKSGPMVPPKVVTNKIFFSFEAVLTLNDIY